MPASPVALASSPARWTTAPVIDYEPAPAPLGPPRLSCPAPPARAASAGHRTTGRPLRRPRPTEPRPPKSAVVFAETALRQLVEVMDRRRPVAQLRPLMTPVLVDQVIARAAVTQPGSAAVRRVRVRCVDTGDADVTAAEVFSTFLRCGRVHAVAGRIERYRDGWRFTALQIG